ncbi:MAG: phosphate signaling complex protein PhoU [Deltaproteobacteria bacterium]|nr:phosphate signaling complex protein PhoU [Deltaproteobacteria bacterium]
MPAHTDKHYEEELKELKEAILKMGGIVEEMIARSMKALVEREPRVAEEVIQKDGEVNQLEMDVDGRCLELLALRQPAASDLRFITIGLRASKDLERMGDLSVNIAEQSLELDKEPQLKPYIDLPQMGLKTQTMVRTALDAFVKRDAKLAKQVCEMDDDVDNLNDRVFLELVRLMQKDSQAVSRGTRLILVSRQLERMADHATNIAEEVIFMVEGRDIRHGSAL